ncbi:TniQ family protein [Nocardia sp. CWNU-33]|uniref:TniQ family protein n=1 Tax=Nocardia sp. CWNU-33 TaxID=3392117 RepID=UPI00398F0BF8
MEKSVAVTQIRASRPVARPPRLAICPRPLPGESLLSWIDCASSLFGLSRTDVTQQMGLGFGPGANQLDRIGHQYLPYVEGRTGLTVAELTAMTAASGLAKRFLEGRGRYRYNGVPQFVENHSPACPRCIAETGGRWQLNWRDWP